MTIEVLPSPTAATLERLTAWFDAGGRARNASLRRIAGLVVIRITGPDVPGWLAVHTRLPNGRWTRTYPNT